MKYSIVFVFILSFFGATAQDLEATHLKHVANIEALKALANPTHGAMVYVQGYHNINDRGGGYFYYIDPIHDANIVPDNGMNIRPNRNNGIWKRINYREVSIAFFGALGGDILDDTKAVQEAIDYVGNVNQTSFPKGGTVYFPKGTYYVQQIVLRNRVSLLGEFGGTIIQPITDINGFYKSSLVILEKGFVEQVNVEGFTFYGTVKNNHQRLAAEMENEDSGMHCFDFNANETNGGLWYANFKNIHISRFKKTGIRFEGGTDYDLNNEFNRVNQFISFENVRVLRTNSAESKALYMFGQNAQINFLNCSFSGVFNPDQPPPGINVWLESTPQNPNQMIKLGPQTSLINFDTCTFENADLAFHLEGAYAINIKGSWFENLNKSFDVVEYCRGVDISNNKFQKAGTRYLLSLDNSGVTFTNNLVRQTQSVEIIKSGRDRNFYGKNNYYESPGTSNQSYFNKN